MAAEGVGLQAIYSGSICFAHGHRGRGVHGLWQCGTFQTPRHK